MKSICKRLLIFVTAATFLSGCGVLSDLKKMNKNVGEMNEKLSKTNEGLTGMSKTLGKTQGDTGAMKDGLTEVKNGLDETNEGLGRVEDKLDDLNGKIDQMGAAIGRSQGEDDNMLRYLRDVRADMKLLVGHIVQLVTAIAGSNGDGSGEDNMLSYMKQMNSAIGAMTESMEKMLEAMGKLETLPGKIDHLTDLIGKDMVPVLGAMNAALKKMGADMVEMKGHTASMDQNLILVAQRMEVMNENVSNMARLMQEMIDAILGKMVPAIESMEDKMKVLDVLNGLIGQMNDTISGMATAILAMDDKMLKMNGTLTKVQESMALMQTLSDQMGQMLGAIKGMTNDIGTMNGKMDFMKTMNAAIEKMSGNMTQMMTFLQKMDQKMERLESMDQNMVVMADAVKNMSSKMDEMNSRITSMDEKMGLLENMNQSMDSMLGSLNGMSSEIKLMSSKMALLENMNDNMGKMLSAIDNMSNQMGEMNGKITSMDQNMVTLLGEMKQMHNTMQEMNAKMSKMDEMAANMQLMMGSMDEMKAEIIKMSDKMGLIEIMNERMAKMQSAMEGMHSTMQGMDAKMAIMEELKAAMNQMSEQMTTMTDKMDLMEVMNENMKTMTTYIENMNGHMDQLSGFALDMREGMAAGLRVTFLHAMDEKKDLEAKMAEATKYMAAFTFQVAKPYDSEIVRENMYWHAVEEFYKSMNNFHNGASVGRKPEAGRTSSERVNGKIDKDNDANNLYALAITLHRLSPYQEQEYESTKLLDKPFKTISLLDLIQSGVRTVHQARNGKTKIKKGETPMHIIETSQQIGLAKDILHMRFNSSVIFALMLGSDFKKKQNLKIFKGLKLSPKLLQNDGQTFLVAFLLEEAITLKIFLQDHDLDVKDMVLANLWVTKVKLSRVVKGLKLRSKDDFEADVEEVMQLFEELKALFRGERNPDRNAA